jgi:glycosyltransferase involved in cell wall biosynthesis
MPPTAKKPLVLLVVNDARFFVTHRLTLAVGIRDAGYDVQVGAPAVGDSAMTIRKAGFVVHHVPIDRQGINPLNDIRALVSLVMLYARLKPQLVHHITVKPMLYGSLAARLTRVPSVVNAISGLGILFARDGFVSSIRSGMIRTGYRMSMKHRNMRAIFQNQHDRSVFLRAGIVKENQTVLIPGSGVVVKSFRPDAEAEKPPIVVLPARLLRRKGIREFVEAARMLKEEGVDARFVLVGDQAQNRDAIPKRDLERWQREKFVELWGWVDDMPSVISRASIVCLPSYSEGVPKALLDACAGARPIVTTNTPGCVDVVIDGFNGLVVPPRDSKSLAVALGALLRDSELRRRLGRNGRALAEKRFGVELVIKATLDAYTSLFAKPID